VASPFPPPFAEQPAAACPVVDDCGSPVPRPVERAPCVPRFGWFLPPATFGSTASPSSHGATGGLSGARRKGAQNSWSSKIHLPWVGAIIAGGRVESHPLGGPRGPSFGARGEEQRWPPGGSGARRRRSRPPAHHLRVPGGALFEPPNPPSPCGKCCPPRSCTKEQIPAEAAFSRRRARTAFRPGRVPRIRAPGSPRALVCQPSGKLPVVLPTSASVTAKQRFHGIS